MGDVEKFRRLDDQGNVYVSPNEMIVRYRPFAELERWVRYRLSEKSESKAKYIWIMVAAFFILGGPLFVAQLMQHIVTSITLGAGAAAGAAAASAGTYSIVTWFYATMAALFAGAGVIYLLQPTHLSLTDKGLRLVWFHRFGGIFNRSSSLIAWDRLSRVFIEKPSGKPSPHDHYVAFLSGSRTELKLRLGAFWTMDDRARVLEAVERWAPSIARDSEVIGALEPPADYSYTELWMKALSAPPKRERLKPLAQLSYLREGKYCIAGALGVGGQGTAYLAYDVGADNRTVVLKEFILPVYVDIAVRKQALDKFEREAKILKQLDHPQIVKLIDFFVEDHRGYLVLEHIDGASLRTWVEKSGRLPESDVRSLAAQMCEILSYLHGLAPPVVHRDFTPDNLILRKDGMLKLVDFNVAQQTDSTATGTVVGKHAYLPPEQFRGQPTPQSDIYAMGATLYYLLIGEDPEPISEVHPREADATVSVQLDYIVGRATAIDAAQRYQYPSELWNDLTAASPSAAP